MRTLTADTIIRVRTPRKTPAKKPLTGDTRIRLDRIIGLKEWHEQLIQDKHSGDKIGTIRRWTDGKLHIKKAHGWEVLPNSKSYDLEEYNVHKSTKHLRKTTKQPEFDKFVDQLFNKNYKDTPRVIKLPKMNKGLAKSLGLDSNTQFIFKAKYQHIGPDRKSEEEQVFTKEEYKKIPDAIRNAKSAYIDAEKHNFFIVFKDESNPEQFNKLIFDKTKKGNYLVTLGKVNKKDELASRKNLLVSGRS